MSMIIDSYRFAAAGGGYVPDDLPDMLLWYDFSDSAQVTLSGSEITSVASKGSNATPLVRNTNGPNGTSTTQNGLAVAAFDGTNDSMWLGTNSNTAVVSQPFTVVMVAQVVSRVTNEHLADAFGELGDRALISGDGKWRMFGGSAVIQSSADSDTSFHVITAIFDGASSSLRIDGTQVAAGSVGTNAITQRWSVGGSTYLGLFTACNIGDVIVDGTALSGGDLSGIETYALDKWGL